MPNGVPLQGNGNFQPRGKLTYTGPKLVTAKSKRLVSVHMEQSELSGEQVSQLQQLMDRDALYRVRIQSNVNDKNSPKVMASIPACMLVMSNFHEIFRVHVDQYGHIRGLWYQTMATSCSTSMPKLSAQPVQLVTSVSVDMEGKGPKLAVEPAQKVAEKEGEGGKPGQENQSFFQKYWMYMLGGIVLVSMLGGEDDRKGGGGGGKK